jgi:hypothetical protein
MSAISGNSEHNIGDNQHKNMARFVATTALSNNSKEV